MLKAHHPARGRLTCSSVREGVQAPLWAAEGIVAAGAAEKAVPAGLAAAAPAGAEAPAEAAAPAGAVAGAAEKAVPAGLAAAWRLQRRAQSLGHHTACTLGRGLICPCHRTWSKG